jgi:small subunit ribosomal protein S9
LSNALVAILYLGGFFVALKNPIRATGRRKSATAQVLFTPGSGDFRINSKPANEYLQNDSFLVASVQGPLDSVSLSESFDIHVQVEGGGLVGQAMAIRLGIARALNTLLPTCRAVLKTRGFLTRDARVKERRKYGLKKARKASQFSKR